MHMRSALTEMLKQLHEDGGKLKEVEGKTHTLQTLLHTYPSNPTTYIPFKPYSLNPSNPTIPFKPYSLNLEPEQRSKGILCLPKLKGILCLRKLKPYFLNLKPEP